MWKNFVGPEALFPSCAFSSHSYLLVTLSFIFQKAFAWDIEGTESKKNLERPSI